MRPVAGDDRIAARPAETDFSFEAVGTTVLRADEALLKGAYSERRAYHRRGSQRHAEKRY
jgi:hypothetical protein